MPPLMHDGELGMRRLQPVDARIVERRHLAVLLRRQPLQPRLARVHDERAAARAGDDVDEALQVGSESCSSMPMRHLTVTGTLHAPLHRGDAGGDELRLRHQAGAEATLLHAVRRAADIEVDLVVAERLRRSPPPRRAAPDRSRRAAAPPGCSIALMPSRRVAIAVQDRRRGHHLGVEQRMARQLAVEGPAVPVRPIHHRGHGRIYVIGICTVFSCSFNVQERERAHFCSRLFSALRSVSHRQCARFVHETFRIRRAGLMATFNRLPSGYWERRSAARVITSRARSGSNRRQSFGPSTRSVQSKSAKAPRLFNLLPNDFLHTR